MARIRKVIDLRTGIVHPTRDRKGRFISRKHAATVLEYLSRAWLNNVWTPRDLSRLAPVADLRFVP